MIVQTNRFTSREIRSFFFSQYFSDGLLVTFGMLLPAVILAQFGQLALGMSMSLAAFCVSLADTPGPIVHKRNGMILSTLLLFLTASLAAWISTNPILVVLVLALLGFGYSILAVYGDRAMMIGTGSLLMLVLSIDPYKTDSEVWKHGLSVLIGGLWYTGLSLGLYLIKPYRSIQQAMGTYVYEFSNYLRLKATCYVRHEPSESLREGLTNQLAVVNRYQDTVRELLLKNQFVIKKSTPRGRVLLLAFIELVDLLDRSIAIDDDHLRIQLHDAGADILTSFQRSIVHLADELTHLSDCFIQGQLPTPIGDLKDELVALGIIIERLEKERNGSVWGLKKILTNLRSIHKQIEKIYGYFSHSDRASTTTYDAVDLEKFVPYHPVDFQVLLNNLHLQSPALRFALRISIAFLIGYLVSRLFPLGHHSYWILVTTLLILKPTFSLSRTRNYYRLIGTVMGGLFGVLILLFIHNSTALFLILLFCMLGSYSFLRFHYGISIFFLTPYILILFYFLGEKNFAIIGERVVDTIIGSGIALLANYFIFPNWGHFRLKKVLREVAEANYTYLQQLMGIVQGEKWEVLNYKLARKQLHISAANLRGLVDHMLVEPKKNQKHLQELQRFAMLNYKLSSHLAMLIYHTREMNQTLVQVQHKQLVSSIGYELYKVLHIFYPKTKVLAPSNYLTAGTSFDDDPNEQAKILMEHLLVAYQVSKDLYELSVKLVDK